MESAWLAGGIRSRQLRRLDWSRWPLVTRTRLNFSLCTIPKEIKNSYSLIFLKNSYAFPILPFCVIFCGGINLYTLQLLNEASIDNAPPSA